MNSYIRRVRPLLAAVTALCLWHVPGAGAATVRDAYTSPGSYAVTIPAYATSVNVIVNGAGGTDGSASGGNGSAGGTGGAGSEVNADIPIAGSTFLSPGDTLKIAVGARGGGGSGAGGNEVGGGGGNGGQASIITDETSQGTLLAIAGGGGGGGGGGGAFAGYNGGAGGAGEFTSGNGGSGTGAGAGGGGGFATNLNCGAPNGGGSASGAGGGTDAGGGGGGGDGYCAGGAGGSGGFGGGGGGGGASGNSYYSGTGFGTISVESASGDGSVILTFTTASVAPQITSVGSDTVLTSTGAVKYQVTSSGNPAPTYSLAGAPSWLSIDPTSGVLSGRIPAGTVARYSFMITADNGVSPAASQQFTLNVIAPKLTALPIKALHGNVSSPFSVSPVATGGVPPYTWSLTSGTLPSGLKLAANGVISGTPTATVTKTVTLTVTDHAIPAAETATESLTIAIAARTLTITTVSLNNGMVGTAYSAALQASLGSGALHWAVSSGALPAGLTLNAGTGAITGTPTAADTSSFTVKVTDSSTPTALVATHALSLTIKPAVQAAVYTSQGGYSGVLSFPLGASGNVTPASTITGGATGLNSTSAIAFDPTGRLYVTNSGTPSITEYAYGTTGNAAPTTTIAGAATGLNYPDGLSVGPNGDLYVSNYTSGTITVYAPGASGNATPVATIGGSSTGLLGPAGLTFDGAGHLLGDQLRPQQPDGVRGNGERQRRAAGDDHGLEHRAQRPAGHRARQGRPPAGGQHLRVLVDRVRAIGQWQRRADADDQRRGHRTVVPDRDRRRRRRQHLRGQRVRRPDGVRAVGQRRRNPDRGDHRPGHRSVGAERPRGRTAAGGAHDAVITGPRWSPVRRATAGAPRHHAVHVADRRRPAAAGNPPAAQRDAGGAAPSPRHVPPARPGA